jgi:hypothetical protein
VKMQMSAFWVLTPCGPFLMEHKYLSANSPAGSNPKPTEFRCMPVLNSCLFLQSGTFYANSSSYRQMKTYDDVVRYVIFHISLLPQASCVYVYSSEHYAIK